MSVAEELFGTPSYLVMDPVHGGIPFFDHERRVIDHPLFQRLRFILQNDVVFLVFPGATHSRFEHSIGSMHVAGRLFQSLVRTYLADPKRNRNGTMTERTREAVQYFGTCFRLAALLHDVGHAPFSHQFEIADMPKRLLADEATASSLWPENSWKPYYSRRPQSLTHEHYSVWGSHKILSDVFGGEKSTTIPLDVIALLETTDCYPSEKFANYAKDFLQPFLRPGADTKAISNRELAGHIQRFLRYLISGELDVDKMDYLLRDSFFSGCRYGMYNLDHLLSTLRVGFDLENGWLGLAITQKGLGPLEDFVNARFQLYLQLYSHKTVVGFKWLLKQAIAEILSEAENEAELRTALTQHQDFALFTDAFFWEAFRVFSRKQAASACARLLRRDRLRYLRSERDLSSLKKKQEISKLRKTGCEVASWESEAKFSNISGTYENLKLLVENRVANTRELDDIKRHTDFFYKFRNTVVTHFFVDPLPERSLLVPKEKGPSQRLSK